jgi:hypothetical protein
VFYSCYLKNIKFRLFFITVIGEVLISGVRSKTSNKNTKSLYTCICIAAFVYRKMAI